MGAYSGVGAYLSKWVLGRGLIREGGYSIIYGTLIHFSSLFTTCIPFHMVIKEKIIILYISLQILKVVAITKWLINFCIQLKF